MMLMPLRSISQRGRGKRVRMRMRMRIPWAWRPGADRGQSATPRVTNGKADEARASRPDRLRVASMASDAYSEQLGINRQGRRGAEERTTQRNPDPAVGADQTRTGRIARHSRRRGHGRGDSGEVPGWGWRLEATRPARAPQESPSPLASAERGAMEGRATENEVHGGR
jgi:hypothetical protein